MSKGISKKQKDILRALVFIDKKLKKDCKTLEVIDKKLNSSNKEEKIMKKYRPIMFNSVKFQIISDLFLKFKDKNNAYKSLRNLEERKLVKIKRFKDKKYFSDVNVTNKGKSLIS